MDGTHLKHRKENSMEENLKQLLLIDLSARLPYGVKFKDEYDEDLQEIHYIKDEAIYTRT